MMGGAFMALRRTIFFTGAAPAAAAGAVTAPPAVASRPSAASAAGAKPTAPFGGTSAVVLVQGAYAGSSRWNGVIQRLPHDGRPVRAAARPPRGLPTDTAAVTHLIGEAGHSTR